MAGVFVNRMYRLNRSTDITRVRRVGKATAHPLVVLVAAPNQLTYSRFAVITGKSLGGAVQRNRAKRQSRAVLQDHFKAILPGNDMLFILRPGIRDAAYKEITEAFINCLKRSGIWQASLEESGTLTDGLPN